jgi:hypothetical protein
MFAFIIFSFIGNPIIIIEMHSWKNDAHKTYDKCLHLLYRSSTKSGLIQTTFTSDVLHVKTRVHQINHGSFPLVFPGPPSHN